MTTLMFLAGLVMLVVGGELLVRGASKLALILGLSPLVIGLTVVSFGTSAPEMAVSFQAALGNNADIALGNVVGSNIFNVLVILGVSALILPMKVAQQMVRKEVPIMIIASLAVLGMSLHGGTINRLEGIILFSAIIAYTAYLVVTSRKENKAVQAEYEAEYGNKNKQETSGLKGFLLNAGLVVVGLAVLVYGSNWFVDACVTFARSLGVSELVIGLTVVAAGTSMPEVVASVMAALKGESDIAVGNVVGSNIFNIFSVLGLSAAVSPNGIAVSQGALTFDIPVMIGVAFACLPIFYVGYSIGRLRGLLFLCYYIAYTTYLILDAKQHPAKQQVSEALLYFALPITAVTLAFFVIREYRGKKELQTS